MSDVIETLRQAYRNLADERPGPQAGDVAWQIHALRGTILAAAEAITDQMRESAR